MNCALRCLLSLNRQRSDHLIKPVLPSTTLARTDKQHGGFELGPEPQLRLQRLQLHERSDVAAKGKQFALREFDGRLHGFSPVG
ncbi:hypothetical protein OMD46_16620 [Pseudomonas sp. MDMC_285]|nr:hypothetical protein [Pseudomonas sp. MDMC_285]